MPAKANYDIDKTAKCGPTVKFGVNPVLANNVVIMGGKFGDGFHVGENSVLAEGIVALDNVVLGSFVCVEAGVRFPDATNVPNHSIVKKTAKGPLKVITKPRRTYTLVEGVCEPDEV